MSAAISISDQNTRLSSKRKVQVEQPSVLKQVFSSPHSNISLTAVSSSTEISTSSEDMTVFSSSSSAESVSSSGMQLNVLAPSQEHFLKTSAQVTGEASDFIDQKARASSKKEERRDNVTTHSRFKSSIAQSQRRGAKRTVSSSAASTSEAHKKLKYTKEPQGDVGNESEKQREETKSRKNTNGRKKYEDKELDVEASEMKKSEQNANIGSKEISKRSPSTNILPEMDSLNVAAEVGDLENVRALIRAGREVDAKTENGETPLLCSGRKGHSAVVKELISAGAEVNATDKWEKTALHHAAYCGFTDIVKELLSAGAEVNVKTADNETPLHCCARFGYADIVKELISAGAEVNVREEDGWTALHSSVQNRNIDIVKILILNGADVNVKTDLGQTPLHISVRMGSADIVKLLILSGADVNAKKEDGWTSLHYSAGRKNIDIIKLLISAGADASAVDKFGDTCFDLVYPKSTYNSKAFVKYTLLYQSGSNLKNILKLKYKVIKYWNVCKKQVSNMKETLLGGNRSTFYDFITENRENKLALYSSEEKFGLTNDLDRISYTKKFSMYAEDIKEQFKKGSERAKLLHKSEKLLMLCFCHTLPQELIRKICESMTNADMENF